MLRYTLVAVLAIIALYGTIAAWPLLTGPTLVIASPLDNESYPSGIVSVSGVAKRAASLTINGMPALPNTDGNFRTVLTFPHGGSILTLRATDRFGKTVTATRNIFVP